MNNPQNETLLAALERAASTLRSSPAGGLVAPMPFGGPGMFNPTPMAQQAQYPTANQYVAQNFPNLPPAVLAKGDMQRPPPQQMEDMRWPYGPVGAPQGGGARVLIPTSPYDEPSAVPMPMARPAQAPQAPQVPMPMARPAEAPQAPPDIGFFMRNALMMQDPNGGGFIDPQGAARAQSQGSLIDKMMGYLRNKADNA